jgi:hypothetical protein
MHRQTRRQIARALHAGGITVHFTERLDEMSTLLQRARPNLIVIDCNNEMNMVEGFITHLNRMNEHPPVVMLSLGDETGALLNLVERHDIGNLVAKHGAIRAVYPVFDERELLVTCEKVLRGNIFGIEKYVGSWGVVLHRAVITSTTEKAPFLSQFEQYLVDLDCPQSVVPGIVTVAEELMLNAIIHAPHHADGTPKYEHIEPSTDLFLESHEHVHVVYGCDGVRLMLSVSDNFGRLDRHTLYKYLSRSFNAQQSPELKPSGAGLGLSLAFRSIHQLIFNIQEGVRTEVIAGWYLRIASASEFRQVGKSFNLFWLPVVSQADERATGQRCALQGRIDENTDLTTAREASTLDLRGITSITSRGLVHWLRFLYSIDGRRVEVVGCAEAFVRAASEVAGVMQGLNISTIMVPFECTVCGDEIVLERAPEAVFHPAVELCKCGEAIRFAGITQQYESFLNQWLTSGSSSGSPA